VGKGKGRVSVLVPLAGLGLHGPGKKGGKKVFMSAGRGRKKRGKNELFYLLQNRPVQRKRGHCLTKEEGGGLR